jgi:hypothetical protein
MILIDSDLGFAMVDVKLPVRADTYLEGQLEL